MHKVLKFGGSSMANAQQYAKVKSIVEYDESRRVVVVSAAGKRYQEDHKITDLLYLCHAHLKYGVSCDAYHITAPCPDGSAAAACMKQAMADADVLINIGNSVPVHMPSKTLEYINTGKPFVNFYKMDDCPTLYYTKRYPLCLNMSEKDTDLDAAAQRFIDFCVSSKGKTVDRTFLETEYADCTPQYIAQKILDALGETNG